MRPSLDPLPSPSSLAAEVQCNVTCACYVAKAPTRHRPLLSPSPLVTPWPSWTIPILR
ncbi:hypothetical protein GW17_00016311 [Ensete ventricosum]|nr:hypothetical protein GW17_00016311 [Ensete ventricosum]